LARVGADQLYHVSDLRKPSELRHGPKSVHDGVETMRGDKLWECRFRTTTSGGGGKHEPTNDADQSRDG
jgi:hypothetical protein